MKKEIFWTRAHGKAGYCPGGGARGLHRLTAALQEDFSVFWQVTARARDRDSLPLVVYRIYPETGSGEMIRGSRIIG